MNYIIKLVIPVINFSHTGFHFVIRHVHPRLLQDRKEAEEEPTIPEPQATGTASSPK